MSQGGYNGGSSKDGGEDRVKVFEKVISTQILIPFSKKPILTTSTTTATLNVDVNMSRLQSKKGLNIKEGVSGYLIVKLVAIFEPKDKGKGV